jgi:hypothetical protein
MIVSGVPVGFPFGVSPFCHTVENVSTRRVGECGNIFKEQRFVRVSSSQQSLLVFERPALSDLIVDKCRDTSLGDVLESFSNHYGSRSRSGGSGHL